MTFVIQVSEFNHVRRNIDHISFYLSYIHNDIIFYFHFHKKQILFLCGAEFTDSFLRIYLTALRIFLDDFYDFDKNAINDYPIE